MVEQIAMVLSNKTQNTDMPFFRVMISYFLGKMASCQRAMVLTKDRGEVPVNVYALSLALSGAGKGHSVGILEDEFLSGFKNRFMDDTFGTVSDAHVWEIARARALRKVCDENEEYARVSTEFARLGPIAFTFDSGTTAAVKQMRQKLLLAGAGSINMQIDEIGSNLIPNTEVLNVFLELFDQGKVKQKLTKNTTDNLRSEELDGKTPTNMLLFGTPTSLLDGGKTEDMFYSFLETGYARRCIFAYGERHRAAETLSAKDVYARLIDNSNQALVDHWASHFVMLADPSKFNWKMTLADDVAIELLEYRIECERIADKLPEHEEIKKSEISHRYFKALKLAGAMAFCDESLEVTMDHLYYAIKLVEESGTSFERIFTREKNYVKLAKYLASSTSELTHADLNETLPFYKGSQSARNEMMTLAMAWGYRNHIIVRKRFMEGIEFFEGEALQETSLEKLRVSYSDHMAYRYRTEEIPWERMHELTQYGAGELHWINHALVDGAVGEGHRAEENIVPGFDMIVIDVDKGTDIRVAQELLKDYTWLMYTTKRHTDEAHRFRIVLPINYRLDLDADDYREFMANVFAWLPFEVDAQTNQRARKWLSHPGQHGYNEGKLLDALQFIPRTSRNDEFKANVVRLENLDNLERWFAQRMVTGSRNNHMLRFAMLLVDSGLNYQDIERRVISFNNKLDNKLPQDELQQTVLVTTARKIAASQGVQP
jgi:hypothetical protein